MQTEPITQAHKQIRTGNAAGLVVGTPDTALHTHTALPLIYTTVTNSQL